MKKKICVIFTGGTIGSDKGGKNLSLSGKSKKLLIEKYREKCGDEISFTEFSPINILSENVQVGDLQKLYECVKGVDISSFDGIIVTHGTDTLCFTVNWFSRVFSGFPKPIVFVSALYPLTDKRSHGTDNFAGAVTFIEKAALPGVFCAFTNGGERCKIHLGSRLIYPEEINGFYHSALDAHFAEIDGEEIIYNRSPYLPAVDEVRAAKPAFKDPSLSGEITLITMRSLLYFATYDFSRVKPKAVIIELSHSGTVCTEGNELNFLRFAEYCRGCGVEVVIGPIMRRAGVYESMAHLPPYVKVSYDTTIEMTIVKVMSALGANLPADAYFNECEAFETVAYPL